MHSFSFIFINILNVLFLSSCGLFSKSGEKSSAQEVRDLPLAARSGDELRKRIIVLPFLNSDLKKSSKVAEIARSTVVKELNKTKQYVIVKNEDFPKDISRFVVNQEYDLESLSKIAAGMGVIAILEGKIQEIGIKKIGDPVGLFKNIQVGVNTTVRLRLVSTKNNKEILNSTRSAEIESTTIRIGEKNISEAVLQEEPELIDHVVIKAFSGLIRPIHIAVDKLSWEGRVALVSGEKIYLNAGRLSGLQIGDILRVTEESEEVYDPETGLIIGEVPGRMKGTLEVISYFGNDGSIAVIHSGSGFRENDHVELY